MGPAIAEVLGYPVHRGLLPDLVSAVLQRLAEGQPQQVVTLNPEMLMRGETDPAFAQLLRKAELVLPDGAGIVWALRREGIIQPRIPGIEFSEALLAALAQQPDNRVALVGAKPDVLANTVKTLHQRYPGLNLVITRHGYFADGSESDALQQAVLAEHPQLVLAALGVPRQEYWLQGLRQKSDFPFIGIGVGGSFDVWSGQVKRAPLVFRGLGLEWLWRFACEPWRVQRAGRSLMEFSLRVWQQR